MDYPRKVLDAFFLAVMLLMAPLAAAAGKPWPSKPITLVVPFPPGGSIDVLGRLIAEKLGTELGQHVIVENRPGANGSVGSDFVAHAAADGYILVISSIGSHAINQLINPNVRYDARKDFTHIALLARTSNVLLASSAFKGQSLMDAIAQAKANPKSINFAITGYGSSGHMSMELFKQAAGIDFNEVPYKGDSMVLNDMLGGQVELLFVNYMAAIPLVNSGKLRALAVTGITRSELLPDVPTMSEFGLDVVVDTWIGLAGPANLPAAVLARLNRAINNILSMPDVKDRLGASGTTVIPSTTQEATAYVNNEIAKWSQTVKYANIHVE